MPQNLTDLFAINIVTSPNRKNELYGAWSSLLDIENVPKNVTTIFNVFDYKTHDVFLDMADFRSSQIIKLQNRLCLSAIFNLSIILTPPEVRYVIISNDDVIFQDEKLIEKIYIKHQENFSIVNATESFSCFSIDKALIGQIGWFDENFVVGWEDIDYRFRMTKNNYFMYRFQPHLVRHLRSSSNRLDEDWNKSSEYFFKKWNLNKFIDNKQSFDDPLNRKALLMSGQFDKIPIEKFDLAKTADFYPHKTLEYKCRYLKTTL